MKSEQYKKENKSEDFIILIKRFIERSERGLFMVVLKNSASLEQTAIDIKDKLSQVQVLKLKKDRLDFYNFLLERKIDQHPIVVYGLEQYDFDDEGYNSVFQDINIGRSKLNTEFGPVIFLITEDLYPDFAKYSPDFLDWRFDIYFESDG